MHSCQLVTKFSDFFLFLKMSLFRFLFLKEVHSSCWIQAWWLHAPKQFKDITRYPLGFYHFYWKVHFQPFFSLLLLLWRHYVHPSPNPVLAASKFSLCLCFPTCSHRCGILFDFIFTGIHIVTWIYRLLSFIDFGIFSAIIPSIYCYFHTLSPPLTPITYDEHDDCVPRITCAFSLFSNLLSFRNSVWIFSIWSLFQFTHLPSAACTVSLSSCWFQLLDFFIFKIFTYYFLPDSNFLVKLPIISSIFFIFSLFLEYIYQIYFKVFFCSFQYLIHLYDISLV